jgi:uncharacterized protein (TIGR00661 family)
VKKKKRILLAPLNWGLGHATRCIPIAHALAASGYEVVFAADGRPLQLLMDECPKNDFIKLPGYQIRYPKNGNMAGSMLWQSRKIMKGIRAEHNALQSIIEDFKIDGVISDNRFGLHSKEVPCIFITHQLRIQAPYLQNWIQKINFKHIQKFSQCWVPDTKDSTLSGLLTKEVNTPFDCQFIGPLSRFAPLNKADGLEILAIVSGPEPQRSLFEQLLRQQLKGKKALLVLGKPEAQIDEQDGDLRIVSHLNGQALNQAMANAEVVVSRSGYSTLMDLAAVEKKAIFIPTPGQTEQLYLAEHFHKSGIAFAMHQKDCDLEVALKESANFTGFAQDSEPTNWSDLFTLFEA